MYIIFMQSQPYENDNFMGGKIENKYYDSIVITAHFFKLDTGIVIITYN